MRRPRTPKLPAIKDQLHYTQDSDGTFRVYRNGSPSVQRALKAWKKADETGDFRTVIRGFSHKGPAPNRIDKAPSTRGNRIDASISFCDDPLSGAARLCIRPETLLDALWTQLAQAIDGSQSLQNCIVCKQWFTIRAGQGRSDKEYCSDACRMRAYRKLKGRAARKPTKSKKR
jgi:hypothetical protein